MKRVLLLIAVLAAAWQAATAYDFMADGLAYNKNSDGTSVTVTRYGDTTNYPDLTSAIIPAQVTNDGKTYTVTAIDFLAFATCTKLAEVTIPNTVTTIGMLAFDRCSALRAITIPSSVTDISDAPFPACTNLSTIVVEDGNPVYDSRNNCNAIIKTQDNELVCGCMGTVVPETVTAIGDYAFKGHAGLQSIELPNSLKTIGFEAFASTGLRRLVIPDSVTTIEDHAFYTCTHLRSITIGAGVTSIADGCFGGAKGANALSEVIYNARNCSFNSKMGTAAKGWFGDNMLTKIVIGSEVERIPAGFVYNQTSITTITLPEGVTAIDDYAFYGCTGLVDINLGQKLETVGQYAFYGCNNLESLSLPNTLTTIGNFAFYGCAKVQEVTIPEPVTQIGVAAFNNCTGLTTLVYNAINCSSNFNLWCNNSPIKNITLGDKVKAIPSYMFRGFPITSMVIPQSCVGIGDYAFAECVDLASLTLSDSLTWIGDHAFYKTAITSVTIPKGVTHIGNNAFQSCTALTDVTYNARNCSDATHYSYAWFSDCGLTSLTLGDEVAKIPAYFAYRQGKLKTVNIPETVTSIGTLAFYACTGLTEAYIPATVTSIGTSAFAGCTGINKLTYNARKTNDIDQPGDAWFKDSPLAEVTFGDEVELIPSYLLYNKTDITSVTLPETVTTIGSAAINNTSITSITIPENVVTLASDALTYNSQLTKLVFNAIGCNSNSSNNGYFYKCPLTEITIGDKVKKIPMYFAYKQYGLTSLDIPNSVEVVGHYAFYGCENIEKLTLGNSLNLLGTCSLCKLGITELELPNSLERIGPDAFSVCYKLKKLVLGNSVKIIDEYAFDLDTCLVDIYSPNRIPPAIMKKNAFSSVTYNNATVHVPAVKPYADDFVWGLFTHIEGPEEEIIPGDTNGDAVVDVADVNAVIDMILSLQEATDEADINGDGVVDIADMNAIIDMILGVKAHEYVDLGLPSGTLWATCNLGANSPEDIGLYYAWGETTGYAKGDARVFDWTNYTLCDGNIESINKYNLEDGLKVLDPDDDAATVSWGEKWRMPTVDEYWELLYNTTHTWWTYKGVNGFMFTSDKNGNRIFLPITYYQDEEGLRDDEERAYYWSSSLGTNDYNKDNISLATGLSFTATGTFMSGRARCHGRTIRAVRSK
ncbi:MAG: leucine-rich repeat protein [Bacteroidales bacterium]|nr:leucine-rich repeat protein [Candidatus Sodaliphilus fimicaballi]